jgi:hypothetical protein
MARDSTISNSLGIGFTFPWFSTTEAERGFGQVVCRYFAIVLPSVTDTLTSVRPTLAALRFTSRAKVGHPSRCLRKFYPVTASINMCGSLKALKSRGAFADVCRSFAGTAREFFGLAHFPQRCRPRPQRFAQLSAKESCTELLLESSQYCGKCFSANREQGRP